MLLLDRQSVATAQPRTEANRPGVPVGRVQLRLRANGQVFELPPGKTTIGSSPRCNVRIEQPGVQPLHCLITEVPEGLRVRSWVANTAINGAPFDESALAVGDCLSLGPVELEVIDPQAKISQPESAEAPSVEPNDGEQVRAGRNQLRVRSRRLLEALRSERTARQELCQQAAKLQESHLEAIAEQNEISSKLESCLAELAAARQQVVEYQSVETARQQLAEQNEQLGFEIGELSAQINELTQGQAIAVNARQKLADDYSRLQEQHRQGVEATNRLQSEIDQFANEKSAADEQRRQFAEEKFQLEEQVSRLVDEKNAVIEQQQQLIEANARLQGEIVQLADSKAAADEQYRQQAEQNSQLQGEINRLAEEKNGLGEEQQQLIDANARLQSEVVQLAESKAVADEQCRQQAEQNSQLQSEFNRIADEKNGLVEEHQHLDETNSRLQNDVVQLANEKAAVDDHNRQLSHQLAQLHNEIAHLTDQKGELESEREGLRRQNEHLLSEARELAGERGTLADERTSLCQERSELRQQNELLRERISQLNDENSAFAVGKLTLVDQRNASHREAEQLQTRVAELSEENSTLAAANESLAEEQARLIAEQKRLQELEREMGAAVSGRENTSAELYRALLQIAEMQERDDQSKTVIVAYESLSKEHDHLHEQADQLKEQIQRLSEERATVESAWQALSAEATTLSESQQRIADENATLVARLDKAQQQLDLAQREQAALAASAIELQREREAWLQAEANIAATIAEAEERLEEQERRFAEQARQFAEQSSQFGERPRQQSEQTLELAEAIKVLERQLAASGDTHDSLTRAREEAQLQLTDAQSRRDEQSRRIRELETQLAAAEERAAAAAEITASQAATGHADRASHVASEQPAEFHWSSAQKELIAYDDRNTNSEGTATSLSPLVEPTTVEPAWDRPDSATDTWRSAGADMPAGEPAAERTADVWSNAPAFGAAAAAADEPNPWGEKDSPQVPVDSNAFGEDDASLAEQAPDSAVSSEPAPIWNQAPAEAEIAFAEPVFAKPEDSTQLETKPEGGAAAKREPVSFIERYSHLLVEDGVTNEEQPLRSNESAPVRPIVPVVARLEEAAPAPKAEEEDSIEQYMAKLLQRVRGDSEGGKAAREVPSRMPLNAPTAKPIERPAVQAELTASGVFESRNGEVIANSGQPASSGELVKRRVSSSAPTTNLGALRALANETARMAISQHELRKLRRNALTKTIVATLAGVTSLWLMLDSPDWRNVQFVTACGALVVAAYWAGEAIRMLFNSMRVKASEGPEETALPIDVDTETRE